MYFVYILKCSDGTLYTGFTNDLKKRVFAHNNLNTGAKYTKARRPVKLVYSEKFKTKSGAMKREWEIKGMRRIQKINLVLDYKKKAPMTRPVLLELDSQYL